MGRRRTVLAFLILAAGALNVGAADAERGALAVSNGPDERPLILTAQVDSDTVQPGDLPTSDTPAPSAADAAQVWAVTQNTTSIAVLEAFIAQFGSTPYAAMARARIEELKARQAALPPPVRDLSRADVATLFKPFVTIVERVRSDYIDVADEKKLLAAAIEAMRKASPVGQQIAGATPVAAGAGADLDAVYDAAREILNRQPAGDGDAELMQAAIVGLLDALDPLSSYFSAQALRDMQVQQRGEFGGLGIEVTLENGSLKVVAPLDGTPAARAGVLANDVITHIDGASVQGLTLAQAVGKMRGPVKSDCILQITRAGVSEPITLTLTRDTIRVLSVRPRLEGDDVGYVRIAFFNNLTSDSFTKAIGDLTKTGGRRLKGFVIDLRNDPGGVLDQVLLVAGAVLDGGAVTSTRGRTEDANQRYEAKSGDATKGKPIIVLVNGGTASGAEILAGALQDNKRATVLGTRSFGRGTVQTIFMLGDDNGALRLTTSRYFTPAGRSIDKTGIVPDIEVAQEVPADVKIPAKLPEGRQSYVPPKAEDDKALQMALALLRGEQTNPAFPPK